MIKFLRYIIHAIVEREVGLANLEAEFCKPILLEEITAPVYIYDAHYNMMSWVFNNTSKNDFALAPKCHGTCLQQPGTCNCLMLIKNYNQCSPQGLGHYAGSDMGLAYLM